MSFFQNTCQPKGLGGKLMVNMMNRGHAAMAEWGFRHIDVREDDRSLDIGCGGGANIKRLLKKSPRGAVVGIDYSQVSVEKSAEMNRNEIIGGRCRILHGDVMDLPFPEEHFHLVTAFETVYFWPDIEKAFEQVYRVLKTGGTFMICNELSGEDPGDEKWTGMIQGMRIYPVEQLSLGLQKAGFSEITADKNQRNWICVTAKK